MNEKWDHPDSIDPCRGEEVFGFQNNESLFYSIVLFRILPVLMVVLSVSCLFFGWIRIPDYLQDDLNRIHKYAGIGNDLMNKYLGTSELAGIDVGEIEALAAVFSDGMLTPQEIFLEGDTVKEAASGIRKICTKLKLENDAADALDKLSEAIQMFRYLYFLLIGTSALTILLILFRKKILGNWYFTIATVLMAGWCWRLVSSIHQGSSNDTGITCTIMPVIAILLSLPLIPYGRKNDRRYDQETDQKRI